MDANRTWTVIVETPSGMEQVVVVRYPRRPPNIWSRISPPHFWGRRVPEGYRLSEDVSIRALEVTGYRLLEVTQSSE